MQLAQRQIDAYDRHYVSCFVAHGVRTTHHHLLRTRIVQVGLAPPGGVNRQTVIEPLRLKIVMLRTTYLARVYTHAISFYYTATADLVPSPFGGIVVRDEGYAGGLDIIERLEQRAGTSVYPIRVIQTQLRHICQHLRRRFQLYGSGVDLQLRGT